MKALVLLQQSLFQSPMEIKRNLNDEAASTIVAGNMFQSPMEIKRNLNMSKTSIIQR